MGVRCFYFTGFVIRFFTGSSKISLYEDKFKLRKHAAEQPERQFISNTKLIVQSKGSYVMGIYDRTRSS